MTLIKDPHKIILCFVCCASFAQQITVNNTVSLQNLIETNLIQGCVEVSNISSPVNGSVNNIDSFGYFERASSGFPFENGVVLSTGNVTSAGNGQNNSILNEGDETWGTDSDLENTLGITNTLNATSITFDFVSASDVIQFNYILASEEYSGNFPCNYSDGFAFLIREAGSGNPFTNIAVVPGTLIPVNTMTIHDDIVGFCAAENEQFFEGYNVGDTNFNGRTTVLTASAVIQPNLQYQIKLIIADQGDENYDSAVFIEGNSFNATVNLGEDFSTCANSTLLDGNIQNPLATYSWYFNNALIAGATQPTYNALQSGNYRVEIEIQLTNSTCTIEDDINITLSSTQTSNPISDYEICDDISDDGVETFDLSAKDSDVLASVPSSNYTITYHSTSNDAQNDLNPITNPISNTSDSQTIFVRIHDINSGCLAFNNFNLVVNPLPDITDPTPLDVCVDNNANGITAIDLSVKDGEITGGQSNLNVSYHISAADAASGNDPLFMPYTNTNINEQLFVSVQNTQTGCISTTTLDISVLDNPIVDFGPHYIDACDADHDGWANFDLTTIIPDVINGLTDVTITFHETNADAISGDNPITDDTNYANIVFEEQIVYIRVENDMTGCASVVPIEIHTNLLLTATEINDQALCDIDNDGTEDFDLGSIAIDIINNIPNITVAFYLTEDDRDNQINALNQSVAFTLIDNPTILYIGLASLTCMDVEEIELSLTAVQEFTTVSNQSVCDEDQDGFTSINLTQFDHLVTNNLSGYSVTYFLTEQNANNNVDALPNPYTNTTNTFTVFPRILSNTTNCTSYNNSFEITVLEAPITTTPQEALICDDDGTALVDLSNIISQVVTSTNNRNISFYNSLADATNSLNSIDDLNYNAQTESIYIRVEDTTTGCSSIEVLSIIVNTTPYIETITNEVGQTNFCEDNSDGEGEFIFETKDAEILDNQTGKEVSYYLNQADADNKVNAIDKTSPYINVNNPQTIYVRVDNITDESCYTTSSFIIEVSENPSFNAPADWSVCDNVSNDGEALFDLSVKVTEISNGIPDIQNVTFYTTLLDAENETNPIALSYTNTANPQQIFVNIDNGTICNSITSFTLGVIQVPEVNESATLILCDDDYDERTAFDITQSEFEILNVRQDNIEITYFENSNDAETDTDIIINPENYTNISNPQTVFMKVRNTISNCFVVIPIDLEVNLPPTVNDFMSYDICENDTNSFNLNNINTVITDDTDIIFSYFSDEADAQSNTNALDTNYTYTTINDLIFARLEYSTTNCYTVYEFNLIVNPLPIANQPNDIVVCDDASNDNLESFDLGAQTITILGDTQHESQYTVTYYLNETSAENGINTIGPVYTGTDNQMVYARIENNTTGCYSLTSFSLLIHSFPNIPQPISLCDVDYDGVSVTFDLTQSENELMLESPADNDISYFETIADLENTNSIPNPDSYVNTSNQQTVYIRIYNNLANCLTYVPLVLNVNLPPIINDFQIHDICENDTNSFNLTEVNNVIVDTNFNVSFSYFANEADAQSNTNALDTNYTYTTTNDLIYGRVEFSTTHCFYVYPFRLRVNPLPIANQPGNMDVCDTDFDNLYNFDFTQQNPSVLGGQDPSDYSITYYNSEANANNATQPLEPNYLAANNETIYVRVENNSTGCYNTTTFTTIVYRKPAVNIPSQVLCLDDLPLVVSAETGIPTDTYQWFDANNTLISTISEADLTEIGTYSVLVTSENSCPTTSTFNVSESQTAFNVSVDILHFSDPNTVTVNYDGIGNYLFQLDDQVAQASNVFDNVSLGYHTVTVIDLDGCEPFPLEFLVIDIPKFFTPNGDEVNPTWHIVDIYDPRLTGSVINIFDRYGKFLKQISYNTPGWDGTYRGQNMPASDYWFTANIIYEGRAFEIKGHFALRR